MVRRISHRFGRSALAVGLLLALGTAAANEVPEACFSFDVGGGDPANPSVTVTFDPTCSTPTAGNPNLFYRAVWEFNAVCQGKQPNPNVDVTGANVVPLGSSPDLVVDPGDNNVLETIEHLNDDLDAPPLQPPQILTGIDLVADTWVRQNIVVAKGLNKALPLPSPVGDDLATVDANPISPTFGEPVITAGPDFVAETFAFTAIICRAGVDGILQSSPIGDDFIVPNGDPDTGRPVIIDGGNAIAETLTAATDEQIVAQGGVPSDAVQMAPVGADGKVGDTNIVVDFRQGGALGTAAPFPPHPIVTSDDMLGMDEMGRLVITTGGDNRAQVLAVGVDDVQVLAPGATAPVPPSVRPVVAAPVSPVTIGIHPGANGAINSLPLLGDDIQTVDSAGRAVVVFGPNGTLDTIVLPDDIQVSGGVPGPYAASIQARAYRMTDDIQVTIPGQQPSAQNPGTDTGYVDLATALAQQVVTYEMTIPEDLQVPLKIEQVVCVRLTLMVALDENGTGKVASVYERVVHLSLPNFPPVCNLDLAPSFPSAGLPDLDVLLNMDRSYDQDGFLIYGHIDWGDGTCTILDAADLLLLPELLGDYGEGVGVPHTYTDPGDYKITWSIIDNGRMPPGVVATIGLPAGNPLEDPCLPANEPEAVLNLAINGQSANYPIIGPGLNGTIETTPNNAQGDDFLGVDSVSGLPVIFDGGNGIVETAKVGDDVQGLPVGPVTGTVAITPGPDGVLDTVPAGDDFTNVSPYTGLEYILDGGNGFVESTAANDDIQVIALNGAIQSIVIAPGPGPGIPPTIETPPNNVNPPGDDSDPPVPSIYFGGLDAIIDGGNGTADTIAIGDDVQFTLLGQQPGLFNGFGMDIRPILRQDSIKIRVFSPVTALKGKFKIGIAPIAGKDTLTITLQLQNGLQILPNTDIDVDIGALTLVSGNVGPKARGFKDLANNSTFKYNAKKGLITIKIKQSNFKDELLLFEQGKPLAATNSADPSVLNGVADMDITITGSAGGIVDPLLNDVSPLIETVRFIYNTSKSGTSGTGKEPRSLTNPG